MRTITVVGRAAIGIAAKPPRRPRPRAARLASVPAAPCTGGPVPAVESARSGGGASAIASIPVTPSANPTGVAAPESAATASIRSAADGSAPGATRVASGSARRATVASAARAATPAAGRAGGTRRSTSAAAIASWASKMPLSVPSTCAL